MKYGLIGEHLPHSFSAFIHGKIGGYSYSLWELTPAELGAFMQKKDFAGINVTIPYKQAVIPYLDEISPTARAIGAVNTVVNRGGKLYGYNTDIGGLSALIQRCGVSLSGKKVLILGTGGTGKTAHAAASLGGAAQIQKVSRGGKDGAVSYEQAVELYSDAQLIINTTPCGMFPNCGDMPIDPALFPKAEAVIDVVYNPLRTKLVQQAQGLGIKAEGGLYMLTKQAVLASELFLDTKYKESVTETVFAATLGAKENIVLTGMPGSGKTTVGGILAQLTGRTLYDTDVYLEQKHGMPVSEMFSRYGEQTFRDWETTAVKELSANSGCIIATGGGAILMQENVQSLKQNGRLYFLDRPLESLLPTADRPLASTADAIKQRYTERYAMYLSTADTVIAVNGTANDVAAMITERHCI